jgi:NAD(P)-dependent dehydrogenase (short-subunit alcohol dehydrogenase family)
MNLSQLRAVVAVAECGNFSEAALSLNLTQSTVSHAIASLEDELGVPLFVRGRHGATLTPAGDRIADYARQVLQLLHLIQQEANLQRSLKGGQVRIAAFRSVATHVLPIVIAQFNQRFPDVLVMIVESPDEIHTEQALREGRADIGFTYLPTSQEPRYPLLPHVRIGSIAGRQAYPGGGVYCATKAAVRTLSAGLKIDLLGTPIRVTEIDPGLVETEFSAVRFHGDVERAKKVYEGVTPLTPEDVAEVALFCTTRPPHVNISEVLVIATDQATATMVHRHSS